jgi:hypothetical protein
MALGSNFVVKRGQLAIDLAPLLKVFYAKAPQIRVDVDALPQTKNASRAVTGVSSGIIGSWLGR